MWCHLCDHNKPLLIFYFLVGTEWFIGKWTYVLQAHLLETVATCLYINDSEDSYISFFRRMEATTFIIIANYITIASYLYMSKPYASIFGWLVTTDESKCRNSRVCSDEVTKICNKLTYPWWRFRAIAWDRVQHMHKTKTLSCINTRVVFSC